MQKRKGFMVSILCYDILHESVLITPAAAIFTSDDSSDAVATTWLSQYEADNTASMTDLVNCILKSAGCEMKVTEDDVNDPDNIPSKLNDMQDEYKGVSSSDNPQIKILQAHIALAKYHGLSINIESQKHPCVQGVSDRVFRITYCKHAQLWRLI